MTRERALTIDERQDLEALARATLITIPAPQGPDHTRELVQAISQQVEELRVVDLDAPRIEEWSSQLGARLGDVLCHTIGWEWIHVRYDNGSEAYGVAPPDRGYILLPLALVYRILADPARENNILALFNLVQEGRLPSMRPKSYLALT